ncbi:MAG: tannase/feruloyl esterase family alpha/beta hydrolase [Vicinamibacterales bacterium]
MYTGLAAAGIALLFAAPLVVSVAQAERQAAWRCADLAALTIPDATITAVQEIAAGPFTPSGTTRALTVPEFCRVMAVATPSPDSRIAIEVWIPAGARWNGKLLGTGNGGFAGSIGYPAMAAGLAKGYATAGTDTGHTGDNLDFAIGHPEKLIDWSYRAIHVMTDLAKQVTKASRGRLPDRAYFEGCSTGGQQALSEAQRYPADYDGIVAGDPGHNRVRLILGFLWSWTAMHEADGRAILPASKLPLLTTAAVSACDAGDGLQDGLIADPLACRFDPAALACSGADREACLTAPQVEAVRKVYQGARHPRTAEQIFAGWAPGSESGWGSYLVNPKEPVRVAFLRTLVFNRPGWTPRDFDWETDVAVADHAVPTVAATSRDYHAFNARGGKLIMYTGLADPVVPPGDTIRYYEEVVKATGGVAETQSFFRFFPVPGMGHCSGGPGPSSFDALAALEQWHEQGIAPAQLLGRHLTDGVVDRTRPLCAFPSVARLDRPGSPDVAESFSCVVPSPVGLPPARDRR